MNDPKKTSSEKFEKDPEEKEQEGLPWDHPDQDQSVARPAAASEVDQ